MNSTFNDMVNAAKMIPALYPGVTFMLSPEGIVVRCTSHREMGNTVECAYTVQWEEIKSAQITNPLYDAAHLVYSRVKDITG